MATNAWGLDPQQPDQASDPELGWTTSDEDWGPAQIRVAAPLTAGWFACILAYAGLSKLRYVLLRSGVGRNTRR